MEKHLQFNTFLCKVQNMQSSICVDAQCNIISKERNRKGKILLLFNYMNHLDHAHNIVLCYLSSKFVVAAEFKTISISFHISSINMESLIPKFSSLMSPGIGVTLSNIKDSRFAPKLFLRTLNMSFSITYR